MFKIAGKQRFGAVYRNGRPIVTFRKGVGCTDNTEDADYLKNRGFTVEGDKPATPDPLTGMSAKNLIAYAQDRGIDLTGVPNRARKILAAIRAVEPLPAPEEQDG